jgi:hypothetical protein
MFNNMFCDFHTIINKFDFTTKIIIAFFFILLSIDTFMSFMFLLFIIVYYIKKKIYINKMIKSPIVTVSNPNLNFKSNSLTSNEAYSNIKNNNFNTPESFSTINNNIKNFYNDFPSNDNSTKIAHDIINNNFKKNSHFFCNDDILIDPNNYVSKNQALAGKPNPKTLIAPVVVAPAMDLDHWRSNNLINHSHINTASQIDTYLSGYEVSTCCAPNNIVENYNDVNYIGISDKCRPANEIVNKIPKFSQIPVPIPVVQSNNTFIESYEFPYDKNFIPNKYEVNNPYGLVNTERGYNPNQLQYNLPSNLAVGNCEKEQSLNQFNKNLFTQTIQPDIFTHSEIIEPINSNIGISFTQQFKPTTYSVDKHGLTFTEHDPLLYNPNTSSKLPMGITEADVYDPRFYGYGTSYRSYTDEMTGQPRFYYDDINSIRMPNYISRSNIDFANYADTYGPLNNSNQYGNSNNSQIRDLAQNSFLNSSLQQRTELQERLMRKRNNEMWQLRKYPIRRK